MKAAPCVEPTAGADAPSVLHQINWRRIVLDEAHGIKDRASRCVHASQEQAQEAGRRSSRSLSPPTCCWAAPPPPPRSTAKAVFALTSKYRWALSGTPLQARTRTRLAARRALPHAAAHLPPLHPPPCVQNRVSELYSLIRFLRIDPYAYYFCRKCDCKCLEYPFRRDLSGGLSFVSRKCDHCGHSAMSHYCWWNRFVANPIKKFGYSGKGHTAMLTLRNQARAAAAAACRCMCTSQGGSPSPTPTAPRAQVLERVLLRRTKLQQADVLALPPR